MTLDEQPDIMDGANFDYPCNGCPKDVRGCTLMCVRWHDWFREKWLEVTDDIKHATRRQQTRERCARKDRKR